MRNGIAMWPLRLTASTHAALETQNAHCHDAGGWVGCQQECWPPDSPLNTVAGWKVSINLLEGRIVLDFVFINWHDFDSS